MPTHALHLHEQSCQSSGDFTIDQLKKGQAKACSYKPRQHPAVRAARDSLQPLYNSMPIPGASKWEGKAENTAKQQRFFLLPL